MKRRDEPSRFVALSLIAATLSIIFFFAASLIFPSLKKGGLKFEAKAWEVSELEWVIEKSAGPLFDQEIRLMKDDFQKYLGRPFWAVSVGEVTDRLEAAGWFSEVRVSRERLKRIRIEATLRKPSLIIRSERSWLLVDERGYVIAETKELRGSWVELPLLFGMEREIPENRSISELNRWLGAKRTQLVAVRQVISDTAQKLNVTFERARISYDPWSDQYLADVSWVEHDGRQFEVTLPASVTAERIQNLQFVLSDLRARNVESAQVLGQFSGRWVAKQLRNRGS